MFNMWNYLTSEQFLMPLVLVVTGLAVGLAVERLVARLSTNLYRRTEWVGYRAAKNALRGMITLWFATAGLYTAVRLINLSPRVSEIYHKGFLVLVVFSLIVVIARLSAGLVDLYIRKAEGSLPSTTILGNIVRIVVILTGILVILTLLDIPITPIVTALGIGGFAVALAFQDTLSNLFSGLHILASRLIKPGDYVQLDSGEEGYVVDVTWRNTTIRTLPNNMVVIPNSRLASAIITNFNQPVKEMSILVELGVSYASDLDFVEKVTLETASDVLSKISGGVAGIKPFIRYHDFSDFRIEFTLIMRVEEFVDQYLLKHELLKSMHRRYQEEGIDIPFPVTRVIMAGERERPLARV